MRIDSKTAAARLLEMDDITLLCHRDPDGDTYGSASALFDALSAMGKQVNIHCPDPFPANLAYLHREMPRFETKHFVAIDMAASSMLGDPKETRPAVELNIDHHPTNPLFAKETFLCSYAAAGEAVYEVIREMGAPVSPFCATALFTALSSDTGGFRYANTTTQTLRYAADLMGARRRYRDDPGAALRIEILRADRGGSRSSFPCPLLCRRTDCGHRSYDGDGRAGRGR